MKANKQLYEADTAGWTDFNADMLRQRRFAGIDVEPLIKEHEDMGKSERRALKNHWVELLMHLLKWQYQSRLRCNRRKLSIANARQSISDALEDSPSLKPRFVDAAFIERAYSKARRLAAIETGFDVLIFPQQGSYAADQLLADCLPFRPNPFLI